MPRAFGIFPAPKGRQGVTGTMTLMEVTLHLATRLQTGSRERWDLNRCTGSTLGDEFLAKVFV
jgi:hypothetical protein